MRKQYHFWPARAGENWDAWDVDRLIELSRDLPVHRVRVDSIHEVDTDYWSDGERGPTVRGTLTHLRLILEVDPAYPIILGADGRVMDGMHRVGRAILEDRDEIEAVRFEHLPEPDHRNVHPQDLPYD
jgi:hypothetical protein